jgi:maltodextrin utilization protein YvdJ
LCIGLNNPYNPFQLSLACKMRCVHTLKSRSAHVQHKEEKGKINSISDTTKVQWLHNYKAAVFFLLLQCSCPT